MKKTPLRMVGVLAVLVAALASAASSQAATILGATVALSELVDDGSIVVGDKEFTDFTYDWTGDMPDVNGVNVIPIADDDGNFGIRFQGAFQDTTFSQGGSDVLITYRVTVLDPLYEITDAHIQGNTRIIGRDQGGRGAISVVETFLPLGANGEFTMDIQDKKSDTEDITRLVDWTYFDKGYKTLQVQKDILAFAVTNDVTMSFVDQTFSQELIPEPTAVSLLALGLAGVASCGRRRS